MEAVMIDRAPWCVVYLRVSTPRQVEEGSSLETQDQALLGLAARKGWVVKGVFSDEGVSGRKRDGRTELSNALNYALEHLQKGDYFLVYNVSRLARNTRDGLAIIETLRSRGILFHDLNMGYEDTAIGNYMVSNMLTQAQFMSDDNRDRTILSMARRRSEGAFLGNAPFGYRNSGLNHGATIAPVPEEAEVVRTVFERIARGDTKTQVAVWLECNDVYRKTTKAVGLDSYKKAIDRWVKSPTYVGRLYIPENDEFISGDWERIIPEDLELRTNSALKRYGNGANSSHSAKDDVYPLKAVLQCPNCGDKFTAYCKKEIHHYYQCKGQRCSPRPLVRVDKVHSQFMELLKTSTNSTGLITDALPKVGELAKLEISESASQRRSTEARFKRISDRRDSYLDFFVEGKISQVDFDSKNRQFLKDLEQCEEELSKTVKLDSAFVDEAIFELQELLMDPTKFWEDAPASLRPEIALAFFPNRLLCDKEGLRTSAFLGVDWESESLDIVDGHQAPHRVCSSNSVV